MQDAVIVDNFDHCRMHYHVMEQWPFPCIRVLLFLASVPPLFSLGDSHDEMVEWEGGGDKNNRCLNEFLGERSGGSGLGQYA